ncbi:MAG: 50S ribosomal protein L15 [Gemmatimonadales bacterium]|nr:50S ribosomal protein L15 [Gemmatimonadales bacterium]HQW65636.1 50S ribosomal protein L15 [Gemmatimonadales bacterium]
MTLSNLRPAPGSHRNRKRIGRGPGSGTGKTSGKGHKGSKARSGGATNPGFEGGQMPMYRRLPKRGFTNPFKVTYLAVNLRHLASVTGDEISPETLMAAGILKNTSEPAKLLGHGEITRAVVVKGLPVSAAARVKVEAAGGRVED